jgi:hypothetical protein
MIWFTWRQFRLHAVIAAVAVVAFGVVLFISGRTVADMYSGVATCRGDCTAAIETFLSRIDRSAMAKVYNAAMIVMYVLPGLIGAFWGAPLIARELEAGTHRLAWNQSVTRTRWLVTKLALVGAVAGGTMLLLSWWLTTWAHRIDSVWVDRITPGVYGARGIVPLGYAVFAFAVGVTFGMLIRRTIPAMAATLVVYVAAIVAMPSWIRTHLVPERHQLQALDVNQVDGIIITQNGRMEIFGHSPPHIWTVVNQTITPDGRPFIGPYDEMACGRYGSPRACNDWIDSLGLRQDLTYHPASDFWPLQWTETGILVAAAGLLAGFCVWWIRRRLT